MADSDEKLKKWKWVVSIVTILIVISCTVGGFFLFRGSETRETANKESYAITALVCKANSPEAAFFSSNLANSVVHTVKITFKDDNADKISYSYEGKFENAEKAESIKTSFHIKYNSDMNENGLDPEGLTPSFVATDNTVRINLYAAVGNLNATVAKLFFLNSDKQDKFQTYSEKAIQKYYEKVGFKCEYKN